jgi:hypothetical protein
MDESADRRLQVERGEIVVAPMAGAGTQSVPKGLIHDWIGAAFIPGATIDSLLCVIHDFTTITKITTARWLSTRGASHPHRPARNSRWFGATESCS